ncbi:multidrug efflux SMR transporter [Brenneria goodwinii]|uniref:DMT family transporter n=1 Tax=Brenneria goodwinii TaxID=1109412 RepID=UPI0036EA1903
MTYLLLAAAIASEIVGALSTRFSNGFTKPWPTALAIVGVVGAYYLLSLVLNRGLAIGVAYAIWAALGVASVAIIGAVFLGDRLTWIQSVGIVLVIGGVVALELGGKH